MEGRVGRGWARWLVGRRVACWLAGGRDVSPQHIHQRVRPPARKTAGSRVACFPRPPLLHTPEAVGPANTIPRCAAKTTPSNDNNRRNVKEVSCPAIRNDSGGAGGSG